VNRAKALVAAGRQERAELRAQHPRPVLQEEALTRVVKVLMAAGQLERAGLVAGSIPDPDRQVWALTRVAVAWAAAGQWKRARQLALNADQVARSVPDPDRQARALKRWRGRAGERQRELGAGPFTNDCR
jgi:hypothetical protein